MSDGGLPAAAPDLGWARAVERADVLKQGVLAARLTRTPQAVRFEYLPQYLDGGGEPVATTLPLTEEPVLTPAGAVPAFFAGLLPEGRRLGALRRAVKTSADDDLSLLVAVGADPIGDVQVVPVGDAPTPAPPLVQVDRDFSEVRFADVLRDAGALDRRALAGVQDKASAGVISVPVAHRHTAFLLKIDPPEYPHLVENEAYLLALARRARFPVASARVVHDADGVPGLLVERFDRVAGPDGAVRRLAVEDGAQALGRYPADKYAVSAEDVVDRLAGLCAARPVAVRELFRQFVFAWLTGNGDLHAKNVSVLRTGAAGAGEWTVSPAYDLPSTLPYGDSTLALTLGGRRDGLSRKGFLTWADRIALPRKAAERVLDDVLRATEPMVEEWQAGQGPFLLPVDARRLRDTLRSLRRRRADLAG